MLKTTRGSLPGYAVALLTSTAALLFSLVLQELIEQDPFLVFVMAVMISSWYGGLESGLLTTLFATLTTAYLFLPPIYSLAVGLFHDVLRLSVFALAALLISSAVEARKQAEEKLERLYQEADRRRQETEAFAALVRDLAASLDLQEVLDRLVVQAKTLGQGDFALLHLVEPEGPTLILRAQTGARSAALQAISLRKGQGMVGKVMESGEAMVTDDYLQDARFSHDFDAVARAEGTVTQAAIPVIHMGTALGILLVGRRTARPFGQTDVNLLRRLADAASLACHHALLYRQASGRAATLERLWRVSQELSASLSLPETFDRIVHAARDLLRADHAILSLWDEAAKCLSRAAYAMGGAMPPRQIVPLGKGVSGTVAATRRPLIVNEYQTFPDRVPGLSSVAAAMSAPLLVEDRFLGTLDIGITEPGRTLTHEELQILELLAQSAASALENARLFAATEKRAVELNALRKVGETITSRLDLSGVLEGVVAGAMELLGSQHTQIILWDEETQSLRYGASLGTEAERGRNQKLELGLGISGTVALTRKPMILDDYQASPYVGPECPDVVATITTPVLFGNRLLGVLHSHTIRPERRFTPDDLRLLQMLANQAAIGIENARLFEQVRAGVERTRQLTQQILSTQEAERRRLSRELHDEAGQALTALKIELELLQAGLSAGSAASIHRVKEAIALTEQTMDRLHSLAQGLRPPALDTVGLNGTLEGLCRDFSRRTRMSIDYAGSELPPLADAVNTCLYRVLQEALTNVAKHAQADRVRVQLAQDAEVLSLSVQDDGCGFDGQPRGAMMRPSGGIGLAGMQERLELLGGHLKIESRPGHGTRLVAGVPWKEAT